MSRQQDNMFIQIFKKKCSRHGKFTVFKQNTWGYKKKYFKKKKKSWNISLPQAEYIKYRLTFSIHLWVSRNVNFGITLRYRDALGDLQVYRLPATTLDDLEVQQWSLHIFTFYRFFFLFPPMSSSFSCFELDSNRLAKFW